MKRTVLSGLMLIIMLTGTAHADFRFYSNTSNVCENISGDWNGTGRASNWLIDCKYHGKGTITPVDASGHFILTLDIDKDSGSFMCNNHVTSHLSGTCADGAVTITTDNGNLQGNFSDKSGSASGSLSVILGMTIDVSSQFQRQ